MNIKMYILCISLLNVQWIYSFQVDYMSCGVDPSAGGISTVSEYIPGNYIRRTTNKFPWFGLLSYSFKADIGSDPDTATTMVVLIHRQFVLGSSNDIAFIPKNKLSFTKVHLGADWLDKSNGYQVLSYKIHPEYNSLTLNTVAVVKLEIEVNDIHVWPVCPPTVISSHNPLYNIIIEDELEMARVVRRMSFIKKIDCNFYYETANLTYRMMRPTMRLCAAAKFENVSCVWDGGSALISHDTYGRWQLIGLGVRGPGCGAPSRYLDISAYLPWIQRTFEPSKYISLLRTGPDTIYLRSAPKTGYKYRETNIYGDCVNMDKRKVTSLYEEQSTFTCDQMQPVVGHYMFRLVRTVNYTCVKISTFSAVNAAKPYLWVEHNCPQAEKYEECHVYVNTTGTIKISFVFTFQMVLSVNFFGTVLYEKLGDHKLPNASLTRDEEFQKWHEANLS